MCPALPPALFTATLHKLTIVHASQEAARWVLCLTAFLCTVQEYSKAPTSTSSLQSVLALTLCRLQGFVGVFYSVSVVFMTILQFSSGNPAHRYCNNRTI